MKKKYHQTITVDFIMCDPDTDEERKVEIECDYSDYIPARLHGPPEDCYPEEGGFEGIVSITDTKTGEFLSTEEWGDKIDEDYLAEKVMEALRGY